LMWLPSSGSTRLLQHLAAVANRFFSVLSLTEQHVPDRLANIGKPEPVTSDETHRRGRKIQRNCCAAA
ncbi:MAG TPA: hypothetical protein VK991_02090, partial [Halomonas sp.]|nr:hypothetical protein [Halomonas sp.]